MTRSSVRVVTESSATTTTLGAPAGAGSTASPADSPPGPPSPGGRWPSAARKTSPAWRTGTTSPVPRTVAPAVKRTRRSGGGSVLTTISSSPRISSTRTPVAGPPPVAEITARRAGAPRPASRRSPAGTRPRTSASPARATGVPGPRSAARPPLRPTAPSPTRATLLTAASGRAIVRPAARRTRHRVVASVSGSVTVNVVPAPGSVVTATVPWSDSTVTLTASSPTPRQLGDPAGGGEARPEDEVETGGGGLLAGHEPELDAPPADGRDVDAGAVVGHLQHQGVALLPGPDADRAHGRLPGRGPSGRVLEAVVDGVADEVGQRSGDPLQHRPVDLGALADQLQAGLPAGGGGGVAHEAGQAGQGDADRHHAQPPDAVVELGGDVLQAADVVAPGGPGLGGPLPERPEGGVQLPHLGHEGLEPGHGDAHRIDHEGGGRRRAGGPRQRRRRRRRRRGRGSGRRRRTVEGGEDALDVGLPSADQVPQGVDPGVDGAPGVGAGAAAVPEPLE